MVKGELTINVPTYEPDVDVKILRNKIQICGGLEHSAVLRTLPLSGSLNRCISDYANAPSKLLALLGTSDMPKPLYEIARNIRGKGG